MLKSRRFLILIALILLFGVGVAGAGTYPVKGEFSPARSRGAEADLAKSRNRNANEKLVDVGLEVPGFGGKYLSKDQTVLYVFLLDPEDKEAVAAQLTRVYGADYLPPWGIRVVQGQYGALELSGWYKTLRSKIFGVDGVTGFGIAHGRNRILVKIWGTKDGAVEAELDRLGVPREAVIIEKGETPGFLNHETLQDEIRPIISVQKITIDVGLTSEKVRPGVSH